LTVYNIYDLDLTYIYIRKYAYIRKLVLKALN
jgi:hypothetical protein